jgi:hypothetical protein
VFDATANATIGRIIDYLAMEDVDGLSDLVSSIAVASNAFHQVPAVGVFYFELSRAWNAWRRSKRMDAEGVVGRFIKQVSGLRATSTSWGDHVCSKLESSGMRYVYSPTVRVR